MGGELSAAEAPPPPAPEVGPSLVIVIDSKRRSLLRRIEEEGGFAFVKSVDLATAGDLRFAEAAQEMAWEQLHSGPWNDVVSTWRDAYAMACLLVADIRARAGDLQEALRVLDLGIIMGGLFLRVELEAAVEKIAVMSSFNEMERSGAEKGSVMNNCDLKLDEVLQILPSRSLACKAVEKKPSISLDAFVRDYYLLSHPVIISNYIDHWPARTRWKDVEYLKCIAGGRTVPVEVGKNYLSSDWKQELITFSQFLDRMQSDFSPANLTYLAQHPLFDQIKELRNDIMIPDYCYAGGGELQALNAWFGPPGTVTPLHHDPHHNIFAQVVGRKYIRLYPESVSPDLYPHPESMLSNSSQMTEMQNHHLSQKECSLKEASPHFGDGSSERLTPKYDLVEQMLFLYMRAVKARNLPNNIADRKCSYYVEAKIGDLRGITKHLDKSADPEWNQVFAFSVDCHPATVLEVTVKKKDRSKDESLGAVLFDLNEMPERVPPDSPLAPQWYRLENQRENTVNGEVMLAVWIGTQADEAFPEAWHSDFAPIWDEGAIDLRSKVYVSPKLWYVRVNVIEVQDIQPSDKTRFPEVFARVVLGNQSLRTRTSKKQTVNHMWNEDLMFVAAEPFEELVVITVEDKAKVMGKVTISLQTLEKRIDCEAVNSKWYNLEKIGVDNFCSKKKKKTSNEASLSSRIHLRISLDGGYHVLDEPTIYSSDLRPTAKQLWQPCIGILELGILGAQVLSPMKIENGRGTADAYCVAKFGQKWIRTRTIVGSLAPKWNEQYTWEVYEPCTVLTIGVFDNCHLQVGGERAPPARDNVIGKVRVRVSTLESDRIYVHFHPLLVLNEAGLRKMGEIQLALRFTCSSLLSSLSIYLRPPLPKMHYIHPLPAAHFDMLRHHSAWIVSMRLGRAEPPLRREAVEYMLDVGSHAWSIRKSKVNFFRIINSFRGIAALVKWFNAICSWKCPLITVLIHIILAILVLFPKLILPSLFINLFFISVWRYGRRPRSPPHADAQLSLIGAVAADELCEEFDAFPTAQHADIVKVRYDRLRIIAGRVQTLAGDLAAQAERAQSLLSWRDPRATALFSMFCLVAAAVLYAVPLRAVVLLAGFYVLRHPHFRREETPSVLCNFFRRLPAKTDCLL